MLVDDCNHLKIVDFGSAQSFTPGQPLNVEHIQGLAESKGTDVLVFYFKRRTKHFTACVAVHISSVLTFDCHDLQQRAGAKVHVFYGNIDG